MHMCSCIGRGRTQRGAAAISPSTLQLAAHWLLLNPLPQPPSLPSSAATSGAALAPGCRLAQLGRLQAAAAAGSVSGHCIDSTQTLAPSATVMKQYLPKVKDGCVQACHRPYASRKRCMHMDKKRTWCHRGCLRPERCPVYSMLPIPGSTHIHHDTHQQGIA